MDENSANVIIKSEKMSQKKKKIIVRVIAIVLLLLTVILFVLDYSHYRKGQKAGLAAAHLADMIYLGQDEPYAEQCEDAYDCFTSDFDTALTLSQIYGSSDNYRELLSARSRLKESFAGAMEALGLDRYLAFEIEKWFAYPDPMSFFIGEYWHDHLVPLCCVLVLELFALVFITLANREAKKEILVYEDSVLCKINSKKSKQLVFENVNSVEVGKNSLTIMGTGTKFKIFHITNAEGIKSAIMGKKSELQNGMKGAASNPGASKAEELKRYKDLLDSGVISQEEFDAKKEQILKDI